MLCISEMIERIIGCLCIYEEEMEGIPEGAYISGTTRSPELGQKHRGKNLATGVLNLSLTPAFCPSVSYTQMSYIKCPILKYNE